MGSAWFETVAVAQRRAKRRLPPSIYGALRAGSEAGQTLADNVAAFSELGFAPHVAGLSATREMATTVMGHDISLPVLISPTGVQAVHPDGEVAVARAAASRRTLMSLSCFASKPVEEVVRAGAPTLFQTYWAGTRAEIAARIERALSAGAVGIIATLDWSFSNGRDWGSPIIPEKIDARAILGFAPEALTHPRWLAGFLRERQMPDLRVPNFALAREAAPSFFGAYRDWMATPPPSWEDVAWLVSEWEVPVMVKGVMRLDDAKRARDAGVCAISVSNHGGNNLDGTPATIRALSGIADAVGSEVEVLIDGGIRRGSDVVKALCLGARAVMIGRAYLFGLAVAGQAGVENVIDLLRAGIDATLLGLGRTAIGDLSAEDLVIPDSFERRLGASG
jgi:heme/flavin dehydrogenase (mycofactocin system)